MIAKKQSRRVCFKWIKKKINKIILVRMKYREQNGLPFFIKFSNLQALLLVASPQRTT
jgi:hypothetical protein